MQQEPSNFKITYCITCGFKSRAEELQTELEKSFGQRAELIQEGGGLFEVESGDQLIFSKKLEHRFPEPGEVVNIILAVQQGSTVEEAQAEALASIPKSPTFEEWFLKDQTDRA